MLAVGVLIGIGVGSGVGGWVIGGRVIGGRVIGGWVGMVRFCPTCRPSAFTRRFTRTRSSTVMPYRVAIAERVSPGCTSYRKGIGGVGVRVGVGSGVRVGGGKVGGGAGIWWPIIGVGVKR